MKRAVFVDTSAFYAVLDADDRSHPRARAAWDQLLDGLLDETLEGVTHGAVVVEAAALVQRRLGLPAVRALLTELVPLCAVEWIDAELHALATSALLAAANRGVSLVDWTSFVVMRRRGIDTALAFDDDFVDQGFTLFA